MEVAIVAPAAAHTSLAEEACVDATLAAVDTLRPGEQGMVMVRWAARPSHPAFAMDAQMSRLTNEGLQLWSAITPEALQGRLCYSAITPGKAHKPAEGAPQATLSPAQDV